MLYYWYRILLLLLMRKFSPPLAVDETIRRRFRVRLFDCEGLRVMTASRYAVYMDFVRYELLIRSRLYKEVMMKGLAPTLGSQKIIYRKPLAIWSKFYVKLELAGWDDKWIYHIHTFEQDDQIVAIGITRALIWRKSVSVSIHEILSKAGVSEPVRPPAPWVHALFEQDRDIINQDI